MDDIKPSKSARKREYLALQKLGESLIPLQESDLLALNLDEALLEAVLEAMATGMPVLATRHGGIPEAVDDGVSGYLVDEGDTSALTARALELLRDEHRFREFAQAARMAVVERFDRGTQCRLLEDYYREAIASSAEARKERYRVPSTATA